MKNILILLILLTCTQLFSQIKFEKGYLIYNNEKKECLIQNDNWLNTPTTITYKLSINSPIIKRSVNQIQELYIYNTNQKYLMAEVQVTQNNEKATKEKLFLKCLLSGEVSLFSYLNYGSELFFFKINNSNIIQLEYSKSVKNGKIWENNMFKQQLFNALKCSEIDENKFKMLKYHKQDLLNIIKNYNSCKQIEYTNFDQSKTKGKLYLSVLAGTSIFALGNEDLSFDYNDSNKNNDGVTMSSKNSFKLGLDAEYRFPFIRNKWGLFSGLNYSQHASKGGYLLTTSTSAPSNPIGYGKEYYSFKTDVAIIEIPIGIRHYSFLKDKNALFYNVALSYNVLLSNEDSIKFDTVWNNQLVNDSEFRNGIGLNLGIGYRYNSTFGFEISYTQMNMLIIKKLSGNSESISFLFSYKI